MFPGADGDANANANYALVGAPLDATASFRPGARFGPGEVRHAAQGFEDFDHGTGLHFSELGVHDRGDVRPRSDVAEYLDYLEGTLADRESEGATPLLVGGEHTVTLAGVRALDPDLLVVLDAHLDLRDRYAGAELSHATVTRRALAVADEAVVLGARTGSEAGWERAAAADITVVPPADVEGWLDDADPDGRVYLSVDIDAVDPAYAPGTGTPEPFGLEPSTVRAVVRGVAPAGVGFDVVEVTDRDDGQAATLAAKLLREFVYAHADAGDDG